MDHACARVVTLRPWARWIMGAQENSNLVAQPGWRCWKDLCKRRSHWPSGLRDLILSSLRALIHAKFSTIT